MHWALRLVAGFVFALLWIVAFDVVRSLGPPLLALLLRQIARGVARLRRPAMPPLPPPKPPVVTARIVDDDAERS